MFPMLFHLHPQFYCSNPISTYPGMEASDCFAWVILDFCRPISKRTWLGVQKCGLGVSKSRRVDWIVYSYFATWFFGSWAEPFFRTIRDPRLQNLQRKGVLKRCRWSCLQSPSSSCRCFEDSKRPTLWRQIYASLVNVNPGYPWSLN